MFELDELRQVIELQEKSYGLLKWVGSALQTKTLRFDVVHKAMSAADAANEWIRRHWSKIPADVKPAANVIDEFARLFSSYLTTSFDLREHPAKVLVSCCGCYCCGYLAAGRNLKTKKITDNARKDAAQLKTLYLQQLAASAGRNLSPTKLLALFDDPDDSYKVSLATYASELLRRTKFASQGAGVLVLWREIAWTDNAPRKNFRLKPEKIVQAERELLEIVKAA